jgi:integrase
MGVRRGELFGLKWGDLDFERSITHVRRSYIIGVEGLPKTESSGRPLPIRSQALEALKVWKEKLPYTGASD